MSTTYVVEPGDTLAKIADSFYGVMRLYQAIYDANDSIDDPDAIEVGQEIFIPDVEEPLHIVSDGETLGSIAEFWYGNAARYMEIADRNGIDDPDYVEVGQQLAIPLSGVGC